MNIKVDKNKAGVRIDKFLKKEVFFNGPVTRGEILRQIKNGQILVNGKKIKPSYILKEKDAVEIMEHGAWNMEQEGITPNFEIKPEVIYEDENIIAINKPAGLRMHPDFHEKNETLANGLLARFPEIKNVGDPSTSSGQVNLRPGIVHRLDKDTSGVLVIARNQKTFDELKRKFKNREMEKKYWVIVPGSLGAAGVSGVINKPLARAASYRKQVVAGKKTRTKIRPAVTEYKVLKSGKDFSFLEASPKTGRTHQIRVHLFSLGHPVAGDKIYKLKNKKIPVAARQLLHARSLKFELFGKKYEFLAEPPRDFFDFSARLDEKPPKG